MHMIEGNCKGDYYNDNWYFSSRRQKIVSTVVFMSMYNKKISSIRKSGEEKITSVLIKKLDKLQQSNQNL